MPPEMGQLGTRSCQIDEFYTEQEKSLNNKNSKYSKIVNEKRGKGWEISLSICSDLIGLNMI